MLQVVDFASMMALKSLVWFGLKEWFKAVELQSF
jgi:hypothetical protein